jgi:hypothetical protein
MEQSARFQHDLFGIMDQWNFELASAWIFRCARHLGEYGVGVRMLPNNYGFQKSCEEGIVFLVAKKWIGTFIARWAQDIKLLDRRLNGHMNGGHSHLSNVMLGYGAPR